MSSFEETHPLAFRFIPHKGEQAVLFIDDPVIADSDEDPEDMQTLTLRLTNVSKRAVELIDPAEVPQGSPDRHFTLLFRPSTLSHKAITRMRLSPRTWTTRIETAVDGTVSIHAANVKAQLLEPGEAIDIKMKGVSADPMAGARPTNVELRYGNVRFQGGLQSVRGSRTQRLHIHNPRGNRALPLHIGFSGGNRVLNDGNSDNSLKLRFTNTLKEEAIRFFPKSHPSATRITLSFDIQPDGESNMDWAIGTDTDMDDFVVGPPNSDWNVRSPSDQAENRVWLLTVHKPTELRPGEHIEFSLNNIRSSTPSGPANVYLDFENVPGFADTQMTLTLEKSPLIYSALNVGIGLIPPPTPPLSGTGNLLLHGSLFDSLTGGGTVTWKESRLSWTEDFVALGNHLIKPETGIKLNDGETLYADILKGNTVVRPPEDRLKATPSNFVFIAEAIRPQVNRASFVRLGNGVTLPANGSSTDGSPILCGTVMMWSGSAEDIPDGWAICNGETVNDFMTPDLRGRFIVGHDPENNDYDPVGKTGGAETIRLNEDQLPRHNHRGTIHQGGEHQHTLTNANPADVLAAAITQFFSDPTKQPDLTFAPAMTVGKPVSGLTNRIKSHTHGFEIDNSGGGAAHENRPPYYVLVFLMKV